MVEETVESKPPEEAETAAKESILAVEGRKQAEERKPPAEEAVEEAEAAATPEQTAYT